MRPAISATSLVFTTAFLSLFGYGAGADSVICIPLTSTFRLNANRPDLQDHATVGINDHQIVVTWNSAAAAAKGVRARLFAFTGLPLSGELGLNTRGQMPDVTTDYNVADTRGLQTNLSGARAVVTWSLQTNMSGARVYDTYARVVSLTKATALTPEVRVDVTPSQGTTWPDVTMRGNGDFIVAWSHVSGHRTDYYVRTYSAAGVALTGPVRVNDVLSDVPSEYDSSVKLFGLPDVDFNENGDALVAWERFARDKATVVERLYNPYTGVFQVESVVDQPPGGITQRRPMVHMDDRGNMLVTWTEGLYGGSQYDVFVKRYDAETSQWTKMCPHADSPYHWLWQHRSIARFTRNGGFVVAWSTDTTGGYSHDVYMRFYDRNCLPLTGPILVNENRSSLQQRPAMALYHAGGGHITMAVTWESLETDGSNYDVYGKLYDVTVQ